MENANDAATLRHSVQPLGKGLITVFLGALSYFVCDSCIKEKPASVSGSEIYIFAENFKPHMEAKIEHCLENWHKYQAVL